MTNPNVQDRTSNTTATTVFQIAATAAAKYHSEYHFHILAFSLLYCFTSVIVAGSTSVPDQNHMGF